MADRGRLTGGQINAFVNRLSAGQKTALIGVTLVSIALIIGLVALVNRPTYGTLFTNLNEGDASKIVEKLKAKEIPYQLDDGGKTVLVPKTQIYDLRLSMAGEGLPQSSLIGYEIFDRTNLGVSDFVQKINYRRALEGELARTILQLNEVEGARVHIVVPERTLFKEDQKSATASVVLKLKSGLPLKEGAVQGIAHLVSSSVEGLEASNVTILDTRGNLLSENNNKANSFASMTSAQYELQQKVETYLSTKAQHMLESVVGPGNAIVQVNAELDFRQAERTMEMYDPEKTVVRSEQITDEKNVSGDSAQPSTRTSSITNYEVNKTIEHVVDNLGNIKRLSVAALVNGRTAGEEASPDKKSSYTPRGTEEMNQLGDIVKKAVGYSPDRKDEISVVNLPFGNSLQPGDLVYKDSPVSEYLNDPGGLIQKIFIVAVMIVGFVMVRSLLGRLHVRVQPDGVMFGGEQSIEGRLAAAGVPRQQVVLPRAEEEISEDALLRVEKRKQIADYIRTKPEDASHLVKVWLADE
jgi:flagellar M-ring protein FliF